MDAEQEEEALKHVVLEQLHTLGVEQLQQKERKGQGIKLLTQHNTNNGSAAKLASAKTRGKANKRSPRGGGRGGWTSPGVGRGVAAAKEEKKLTPRKSPFASARRKAELRRQQLKNSDLGKENVKVFGRGLSEGPGVSAWLGDGTQVEVPGFVVDVCANIRASITTQGIFRKAGSSQRQADLKRLVDSGSSLPSSAHVIDCACLLKQFLRCLPEPLLSPHVHARIVRCMELAEDDRVEAVLLCLLLLSRPHRHTLIYLMDFFAAVVEASESNLMDAKNLAIVLAPNLLPPSLSPSAVVHKTRQHTEDTMLATNIDILQMLVENGRRVCRVPSRVAVALEQREQSRSAENLLAQSSSTASAQPDAPSVPRKKRRSASIHRLVTGLRWVVGSATSSSSSASRVAGDEAMGGETATFSPSVPTLHSAHSVEVLDCPPDDLPLLPSSPRKRKSAGPLELHSDSAREGHKRPKVEESSADSGVLLCAAPDQSSGSTDPTAAAAVVSAAHTAALTKKASFKVGKPRVVRDVMGSRHPLPAAPPPGPTSTLGPDLQPSGPATRQSGMTPSPGGRKVLQGGTVGTRGRSLEGNRGRRSLGAEHVTVRKSVEGGGVRGGQPRSLTHLPTSPPVQALRKRRSCDVPLSSSAGKAGRGEKKGQGALHRASLGRRVGQNEPDGAAGSPLGPRGVPDGAECNLRDAPVGQNPSPLSQLEQHYQDIKQEVQQMEQQLDQSHLRHLQQSCFPHGSTSPHIQNLSCSEMIQSAYERMKEETRELGPCNSNPMTRRLGRELRSRNRRSDEHRVIRSPSQRKIGTMRRRSKELVQNTARSTVDGEESPAPTPSQSHTQTPRMKASLMQTPATAALRRGRPNSVRSGLPVVVRSSPTTSVSTPQTHAHLPGSCSRRVLISKRGDQASPTATNQRSTPNTSRHSAKSPHVPGKSPQDERQRVKCHRLSTGSDIDLLSPLDISGTLGGSRYVDLCDASGESLASSFLELAGPLTRSRRSSLASLTAALPNLSLTTPNSSLHQDPDHQDASTPHHTPALSQGAELGGEAEDAAWVPAVDFLKYVEAVGGEEVRGGGEGVVGRPSLAALLKQKKVATTVQLFNNLHPVTPRQQRRLTRLCSTPDNTRHLHPPHSTVSEKRPRTVSRLMHSASLAGPHQSSMTPRELLRARQKSFRLEQHTTTNPSKKVAVVSPLKESSTINIQQESSCQVSKPLKGEATAPQRNHGILSPPSRSSSLSSIPPKLPPRGVIRPSPLRVQYR